MVNGPDENVVNLGKPQRIYLGTVLFWLVALIAHAGWHIWIILSDQPSPDLYANSLGFQVIAYALFWLPYFLVALFCLLLVEFMVFGRKSWPLIVIADRITDRINVVRLD